MDGLRGGIAGVGSDADFGNVQCTVDSLGFLPDSFHAGSRSYPANLGPSGEPSDRPPDADADADADAPPGGANLLFVFGDAAPIATDPPADGPMADRSEPKPIGP